jgi:UDP-hydrolysing UDP-N-acetyl-D-glucosamine 2-epimerase
MHLSPEFGLTVHDIVADGFEIAECIEMLLSSDTPEGVAKSIGLGAIGFAQAYARFRPNLLLVLGDRFEMYAAVIASLPFKIPVAHLHGGESTEGSIDEAIRHSITKMSHLHFVSTQFYARRVMQMGEEPWRVVVSGAPSLDNLRRLSLLSRRELEEEHGLNLQTPTLLVTYHPVTLEFEHTKTQMEELLTALDEVGFGVVFTYPNADTRGRQIIEMVHEFTTHNKQSQVVVNLGTQGYFSLMSHVIAMVGNSSSGIIEAASFQLPVVNIGIRQRGRVHGKNVINVGNCRTEIREGIFKATSDDFKSSLEDLVNPYGDGQAVEKIVHQLKHLPLNEHLFIKRFYDIDEVYDADCVHWCG